jgi:hypothetical protein
VTSRLEIRRIGGDVDPELRQAGRLDHLMIPVCAPGENPSPRRALNTEPAVRFIKKALIYRELYPPGAIGAQTG